MDGMVTKLNMAFTPQETADAESKGFAGLYKPSGIGSSAGSGESSMPPLLPGNPASDPDGSFGSIPNIVFGTRGNDMLVGTEDNDHIFAMEGNDQLDGGDGDDLLAGEAGNDSMTGGEGNDIFILNDGSGSDTITDFTPGEDILELFAIGINFDDLSSEHTSDGLLVSWGENSVLLEGITADLDASWFSFILTMDDVGIPAMPHIDISIIEGTNDSDTLTGTADPDNIFGNGGNDLLSGGAGNDVLFGGEGSDTLTGGADADIFVVDATIGNDVITDFDPDEDIIDMTASGFAFDDLSSNQTADGLLVSWEGGSLLLAGVSGDIDESWFYFMNGDPVGVPDGIGGADGDVSIMPIFPGLEIRVLEGTNENDTLTGDAGTDFIFGFAGNDVLKAGKGDDLLNGGEGNDSLTGGAGQDSFQFDENSGNDTITDFTAGEDIISFSQMGLEFDDLATSSKDGGLLVSWDGGSVFLVGVSGGAEEDWFNFYVEHPDAPIAIGF